MKRRYELTTDQATDIARAVKRELQHVIRQGVRAAAVGLPDLADEYREDAEDLSALLKLFEQP